MADVAAEVEHLILEFQRATSSEVVDELMQRAVHLVARYPEETEGSPLVRLARAGHAASDRVRAPRQVKV